MAYSPSSETKDSVQVVFFVNGTELSDVVAETAKATVNMMKFYNNKEERPAETELYGKHLEQWVKQNNECIVCSVADKSVLDDIAYYAGMENAPMNYFDADVGDSVIVIGPYHREFINMLVDNYK